MDWREIHKQSSIIFYKNYWFCIFSVSKVRTKGYFSVRSLRRRQYGAWLGAVLPDVQFCGRTWTRLSQFGRSLALPHAAYSLAVYSVPNNAADRILAKQVCHVYPIIPAWRTPRQIYNDCWSQPRSQLLRSQIAGWAFCLVSHAL